MVSHFCGIDLKKAHVTQTLIFHGNLAKKRKSCGILADRPQVNKLFSFEVYRQVIFNFHFSIYSNDANYIG